LALSITDFINLSTPVQLSEPKFYHPLNDDNKIFLIRWLWGRNELINVYFIDYKVMYKCQLYLWLKSFLICIFHASCQFFASFYFFFQIGVTSEKFKHNPCIHRFMLRIIKIEIVTNIYVSLGHKASNKWIIYILPKVLFVLPFFLMNLQN
jgi:hypothetical protein